MQNNKQNPWHAIALSSEVTNNTPLARQFNQQALVLFRDSDNTVRVLEDFCVHRRAPLSLGKITPDGLIECPYHGWRYEGKTGKCKKIPNLSANESLPKNLHVQTYNCHEQQGFVYLSMASKTPRFKANTILTPRFKTVSDEGSLRLTIHVNSLQNILLDAPSLLIDSPQIRIIDDHWMGEPVIAGDSMTIERVADWSILANSRQRIASDYPLYIRIQVDSKAQCASVDLFDNDDQHLGQAHITLSHITNDISAIMWRWHKSNEVIKFESKKVATAFNQLSFGLHKQIDADQLLSSHRYMSGIQQGLLEPYTPPATVNAEV